jgi:hypothetical protein
MLTLLSTLGIRDTISLTVMIILRPVGNSKGTKLKSILSAPAILIVLGVDYHQFSALSPEEAGKTSRRAAIFVSGFS